MDDKMYIGTTEIEKWELVFSPFSDDEACKKFVQYLAEFIGEPWFTAHENVERLVDVVIRGNVKGSSKEITTARISSITKLSKWTIVDRFCYRVWVPWGIRQRYFVETVDRKRYVVTFTGLGQDTFRLIEAALHEEEAKLKRGFV